MDELFAAFRSEPGTAGILSDFDGTLAPIVDDPDASRPLPEAVDLLHRLATTYRRVAVISGRPASFLSTHLRLAEGDGLMAIGLYGLETADGDQVSVDPRVLSWLPVVDEVACLAEEQATAGVYVERKGLSVTLHYRTTPSAAAWVTEWAAAQAGRTGLICHPARMSEELRPPLPVDKGTVVAQLAEGLRRVCFVGDDVGDLPAFAALDALASSGAVTTVKVGVRSEEAPPELLAGADLVVDGPGGVVDLLSRLLAPTPA